MTECPVCGGLDCICGNKEMARTVFAEKEAARQRARAESAEAEAKRLREAHQLAEGAIMLRCINCGRQHTSSGCPCDQQTRCDLWLALQALRALKGGGDE